MKDREIPNMRSGWPIFEADKRRWERLREAEIRGYGTGMLAEPEGIRLDTPEVLLLTALILLLRMDNILFLENQTGSTPVAGWDAEA